MPFVIDINPVIASFGGLAIRWYSLALLASAAAAILVFTHEARCKQLDERAMQDGIWWVAIAALIGGRVLYELQNDLPMLGANPLHAFMVWEGGLSFYGGLIAAIVAIGLFARLRGMPLWPVLDAAAPAAAIGQAIGHVGCLITGDSFGLPTTLPWAVIYRNPAAMAPLGVPLQPTQAYEAIALGFLFAVLWLGRDRIGRLGAGAVAGSYLIGIAGIRFVLFFLRDEQAVFFGLKTAQVIGLGLALGGVAILATLIRRRLAETGFPAKEIALP